MTKILLSIAMLLGTAGAWAGFADDMGNQKRVVVNFNNVHLRGMNIIKIKRELKNKYPNLRLRDYAIASASLVAKTRGGKGRATLLVGNTSSEAKVVSGNRRAFRGNGGYIRVHQDSPANLRQQRRMRRSRWQMEIRGNFKVRQLEVHLVPLRRRQPGHGGGLIGDIIDNIF